MKNLNAINLPFGFKVGFGYMLDPDRPFPGPPWYHWERYLFWMHRVAPHREAGGYVEFWQIRVLWFYLGRGWSVTEERFADFWLGEE